MNNMYFTKTDYMIYLQCPKSFWLYKNKPDVYTKKEFTEFLQKLMKDGYEVEEYAQKLFGVGVSLPTVGDVVEKTKEALKSDETIFFQPTFQTDEGMFARLDVLEKNDDGSYNIYEVKSSTSIKENKTIKPENANHIKDVCFQKIALEKSGYTIKNVYIIYVNGSYVFDGEIDVKKFLKKENVNDRVENIYEEVKSEVSTALKLLKEENIEEGNCGCINKTKSGHCDSFVYFNGELPSGSIYELPRISEKKIIELNELGIIKIEDIGDNMKLTPNQVNHMLSLVNRAPVVFESKIIEMFDSLIFPLYFFDYEASSSAVPRVIGSTPWQQIPFQFSLHILHEDGTIEHKESLSRSFFDLENVFKDLREFVSDVGSVIVWHKSFEQQRNIEMAEFFPKYKEFLLGLNERIFDLKEVFINAYIDGNFGGSFSIKKVLPVICPQLSYSELDISDGTSAMEKWLKMASFETEDAEKDEIYLALLEYCKLDTFAMVELYKFLKNSVSNN